jgi:hypothetical protein
MGAWRPYANLVAGELDNREPGKVTGWLRFTGMREDMTLDLKGDFHRDIRGTLVRLRNDTPAEAAPGYMDGVSSRQTGKVGDMTAGRAPMDYVEYPYFEWYSEQNGRVVLELSAEQVEVIGTPRPWKDERPVSRAEQEQNMGEFLAAVAASFDGERHDETPAPAPEKKSYSVLVEQTVRFSDTVEVEARTAEEARSLASEDFQTNWERADLEATTATVIEGAERTTSGVARRLHQAERALAGYRDEDRRANLTDCLADLMHWAREHGVDFEYTLSQAKAHHECERPDLAGEQAAARQHER